MVANFVDLGDFGYGNEFGFASSDLEVDLEVVVRVLWALASFFFLGRNHNGLWLWVVIRQ